MPVPQAAVPQPGLRLPVRGQGAVRRRPAPIPDTGAASLRSAEGTSAGVERELSVTRAPSCHRAPPHATFSLGWARAWFPGPGKGTASLRACRLGGHPGSTPLAPSHSTGQRGGQHPGPAPRQAWAGVPAAVLGTLGKSHSPVGRFLACSMGYRSTCATWRRLEAATVRVTTPFISLARRTCTGGHSVPGPRRTRPGLALRSLK